MGSLLKSTGIITVIAMVLTLVVCRIVAWKFPPPLKGPAISLAFLISLVVTGLAFAIWSKVLNHNGKKEEDKDPEKR